VPSELVTSNVSPTTIDVTLSVEEAGATGVVGVPRDPTVAPLISPTVSTITPRQWAGCPGASDR